MELFKNITGSPKTTIAGAVLMAGSLALAFMKVTSWVEVSPALVLGTWLFIAKDGKSNES